MGALSWLSPGYSSTIGLSPWWLQLILAYALYWAVTEAWREAKKQNLVGKTVLITGCAMGIGRMLALEFAGQGCKLVLWDVLGEQVEELARDIRAGGGQATAYKVDITDSAALHATARRVDAEVGPPDVIVNNAGVVHGKHILEANDAQIERTYRVNTMAHAWMMKAFLPEMLRRGTGHLVTIASASAYVGVDKLADYAGSKAAAFTFAESVRMEMKKAGHSGIKTLIVCPYYIKTGMFEGVQTRFPFLLPLLEPEHVARRIVQAVQRGDELVCMPPIVYAVPLLRTLLPVPAFDALCFFLGINASMDHFTGRAQPAPDALLRELPASPGEKTQSAPQAAGEAAGDSGDGTARARRGAAAGAGGVGRMAVGEAASETVDSVAVTHTAGTSRPLTAAPTAGKQAFQHEHGWLASSEIPAAAAGASMMAKEVPPAVSPIHPVKAQ